MMLKLRRVISFLLVLVTLASICMSAGAAEAGIIEEEIQGSMRTGLFYYADGSTTDYSSKYYYDDAYFQKDATIYNPSLATMSLSLAMSAFASNKTGYDNQGVNVKALLSGCGFNNVALNDRYTTKPTADSIGVALGSKTLAMNGGTYTLIAVAICGGNYEDEWASNFTIGTSKHHQGFTEAKDKVKAFLASYISEYKITGNVKLWITGYSRAAATSNLLAGDLTNAGKIGSLTLTKGNIYAYCFECPAGALRTEAAKGTFCTNIFNIINAADPVTKVAPADMGFGRYGKDRVLPSRESNSNYDALYAAMMAQFDQISKDPQTAASVKAMPTFKPRQLSISLLNGWINYEFKDIQSGMNQSTYVDTLLRQLVRERFKDRNNYVANYQDGIRNIFILVFGREEKEWSKVFDRFMEELEANIGKILYDAVTSWNPKDKLSAGIADCFKRAQKASGMTVMTAGEITEFVGHIVSLVLRYILDHPEMVATLISNLDQLGAAHQPTLCLAWLRSFDKNYNGTEAASNSGSYRILRLSKDTAATIYNEKGTRVAEVMSSGNPVVKISKIIAEVNSDDETLLYIPGDSFYRANIFAVDSSKINYSIKVYDAQKNRIVSNVLYRPGKSTTVEFPVMDSGEGTNGIGGTLETRSISLNRECAVSAEGKPVEAIQSFTGDAAENAYCIIELKTNDPTYGIAVGAGARDIGDGVKVVAYPSKGYTFDGWYNSNNKKLSASATYYFTASADITLEARFVPGHVAPFVDVPSSAWYADAVRFAINKNLFNGVDDDEFAPDNTMTRAMLVTVLHRYAGKPTGGKNPFKDVPNGQWYTDAIAWASSVGVVNGMSATEFNPNGAIAREQAACILYRYAKLRGANVSGKANLSSFPDCGNVSSWATEAMSWAVSAKLISGSPVNGKNHLLPQDSATRAQLAAIIMRFDDYLN